MLIKWNILAIRDFLAISLKYLLPSTYINNMGFHINKKIEAKSISKNTKASGGIKKPIKTGGARGS
jgi:hypothetical protein